MKIIKELLKGSTAILILKVIAEEDSYGYRITRSVRSRRRRKEVRKEYAEHIEDRMTELTLDTGKVRYIINLWATVRKKKTLRLMDNGLYSYEDNIGLSLVVTYPDPGVGMNLWAFIPQNMDHVPIMFTNLERSLPKGMHLMPRIDWESYERADRENVRILMLSPIPMSVAVVENSRERPSGGGEKFCGMHIWSASSFLSYLEGIRLKERR